ncbi:endonuclease/exonuclease/phosphatase family protein [Longispora sp. NPDC051575]|uniref:endonuclease/exonuclease/phosphatase family protein n=1 Tax=Longispora sp. NPDC051575 TaxID=3154943 RepID=UPI003445FE38
MALGIALLIDVLRVWLPSLITVYGAAGSTPAEQLGLFALACFAVALLGVPLARWVGPGRFATASVAGLAVARIFLQATHGGRPQLYLATAALICGLWWLVGLAVGGLPGRAAANAVLGGFALSALGHAVLGGVDLMWRTGWWVWLVLVLAGLAAVAATPRAPSGKVAAPAGFWFAVGPAVLLFGILGGATARVGAAAGVWAVAVLVGACVLGNRLSGVGRKRLRVPLAGLAALLLLGSVAVANEASGWLLVAGSAGVAVGLGLCLGAAARAARAAGVAGASRGGGGAADGDIRSSAPDAADAAGGTGVAGTGGSGAGSGVRRGLAAAGGLLVCVTLLFGYYASYDLDLGSGSGSATLVAVLLAALAVAVPALLGARAAVRARARVWPRVLNLDAVLAGGLALLFGLWALPAVTSAEPPGMLRLVSYNIRMGFDLDGRFSVDALAATIQSQNPDVVLLSEVDRGWFLNGGHDTLGLLAERLGMRYVFAPAADQVWGDAVLTRATIVSSRSVALPREGPTGAQALGVVLRVAGGRELAVVSTHFQPAGDSPAVRQATAAAELVRELSAGGRPVVLAGDLNIEPGAPAFAPLAAVGLTDALAPSRPVPTFPADVPTQQIDHVLVTAGLVAHGVVTPESRASDHRAVAVSLQVG